MPGENEALETFLTELQNYLFDPGNYRKVKDNVAQMQRNALRNLSTWNSNPNNDRMFRIQDKGSRLVIEWKDKYREKMLSYLQDVSIFKELKTLWKKMNGKLMNGHKNGTQKKI